MKKRTQFFTALAVALVLSVISALALPDVVFAQATSGYFFVQASAPAVIPSLGETQPVASAFVTANPGVTAVDSVGICSTKGGEDVKVNSYYSMNRAERGATALRNAGFAGTIHREVRVQEENDMVPVRGILFLVHREGMTEKEIQALIDKAIESLKKDVEALKADVKRLDGRIDTTNADLETERTERKTADMRYDRDVHFLVGPAVLGVASEHASFGLFGGEASLRYRFFRTDVGLYYGASGLPDWGLDLRVGAGIPIDFGEKGHWSVLLLPQGFYNHFGIDVDSANEVGASWDGGGVSFGVDFHYTTGRGGFSLGLIPRVGGGYYRITEVNPEIDYSPMDPDDARIETLTRAAAIFGFAVQLGF